jgi:hypothetical protein
MDTMMKYSKEYQEYVSGVLENFSKITSVENDYWDYCNFVLQRDGVRYTFYGPNERTLIDMSLDGSFEIEGVKEKISKRGEWAKEWLSNNLMSYNDWLKNH